VAGLAVLVLRHFRDGPRVHLGVFAARNEGGHSTDGVRAAGVTGGDEELRVRPHEGNRHGDLDAVGQDHRSLGPELLDDRKYVVPTAGVERGPMVPKLVQDLFHLERTEYRLDQNGATDGAVRDTQGAFRECKDVVPETRLEV